MAGLNPAGRPDKLVAICIPNMWEDVSLYCELCTSMQPTRAGIVTGHRSLRYHNGDDKLWPMRTESGDLIRNDGGHMLRNPAFRAGKYSVEPVSDCTWPVDVPNKGMWHVEQFIRPLAQYFGKQPPRHLLVDPPALVLQPPKSRESELEKRVAELENQLDHVVSDARSVSPAHVPRP